MNVVGVVEVLGMIEEQYKPSIGNYYCSEAGSNACLGEGVESGCRRGRGGHRHNKEERVPREEKGEPHH